MKAKKLLLASAVMLIFSISIILFNLSCNKPADAQQNQSNCVGVQAKLQFKGNGVLYECNAVFDSRVGWVGYPYINKKIEQQGSQPTYKLAFKNYKNYAWSDDISWIVNYPATQNTVDGSIYIGSTISVGTYTNTNQVIFFEKLVYKYEDIPKCLVVNITSINNGLASGTFSGTLPSGYNGTPNQAAHPQMNITEGVFSNVPIFD
jgi:hypothetical protein